MPTSLRSRRVGETDKYGLRKKPHTPFVADPEVYLAKQRALAKRIRKRLAKNRDRAANARARKQARENAATIITRACSEALARPRIRASALARAKAHVTIARVWLNALARARAKAEVEELRIAERAAARARAKAEAEAAASRFRAAVAAVVPAANPGTALVLPAAAYPAVDEQFDVHAYIRRLNIVEINRLIDNSNDFGFDVLANYYQENPVAGLPLPGSDMLAMIYSQLGRNAAAAVPPQASTPPSKTGRGPVPVSD
jgi:hypothetical protein